MGKIISVIPLVREQVDFEAEIHEHLRGQATRQVVDWSRDQIDEPERGGILKRLRLEFLVGMQLIGAALDAYSIGLPDLRVDPKFAERLVEEIKTEVRELIEERYGDRYDEQPLRRASILSEAGEELIRAALRHIGSDVFAIDNGHAPIGRSLILEHEHE